MGRFFLLFLCFLPFYLQAQELNRYMVFFKDKEQNTFSVDEPHEFLSPRAIARREQQQIALTEMDLPVSQPYVHSVKETGASVFYQSRWFNGLLVEATEAGIETVKALPEVLDVQFIAPGSKLNARKAAADKKAGKLKESAPTPASAQNTLMGVPQMQEAGFTGEGKLIAVLDGGFSRVDELPYFNHLFEGSRLHGQWDFTSFSQDVFRYTGHGTKALSTISAIDSSAFIGTAPLAGILLAVTEDVGSEYVIEEYNWLLAAEWADSAGADVISASLGYNSFDDVSMNYSYQDLDGATTVSARAASMAAERGMVVVVSAGNSGNNSWKYIVSPADARNVLAVGAIKENGEIAGFSSLGPSADGRIKPDVVAMGQHTLVADLAGGFTHGNGTSYAAPQVAGFAAALWQAFPEFTSLQIRELIMQSGHKASLPDTIYGWGKPFFPSIQSRVLSVEAAPGENELKIYPNPLMESQLFVEFPESKEVSARPSVRVFTTAGKEVMSQALASELNPQGKRVYILQLEGLQKGVFVLHLYQEEKQYVHKILKY